MKAKTRKTAPDTAPQDEGDAETAVALLEEDAANQTASPDMLARIVTTADTLATLTTRAKELEEELSATKAEMRRLQEQVLPTLLDEASLPELFVDDDLKVVRGEQVHASISEANTRRATEWLVKNGYGDIVKAEFRIPVTKGDTAFTDRVRAFLTKSKLQFAERSSIHPQTLNAFVREQLEKGAKLPSSITYHVQPLAVLKAAKVRKPRRAAR